MATEANVEQWMRDYMDNNKPEVLDARRGHAELSNVEKKILTLILDTEYKDIPSNKIEDKILNLTAALPLPAAVDIKKHHVKELIDNMMYNTNESIPDEVELADDNDIAGEVYHLNMNPDIQINFLYVILMVKYAEGLTDLQSRNARGKTGRGGREVYPIPRIEYVEKLLRRAEEKYAKENKRVSSGEKEDTLRSSEPPPEAAASTPEAAASKRENFPTRMIGGFKRGGKKSRRKRTKRRTTGDKKSRRRLRKRTTLKGVKRKLHRTRRRR